MYGSGPASPGPGPVSSSTGMETAETVRTTHTAATQPSTAQQSTTQPSITQASTLPDSLISPATPGTVESGGDALYEMDGMSMTFLLQSLMGNRYYRVLTLTSTQTHHLLSFPRHSILRTLLMAGLPSQNLNVGSNQTRDEGLSLLSHRRLLARLSQSIHFQQVTTGAHLHCH